MKRAIRIVVVLALVVTAAAADEPRAYNGVLRDVDGQRVLNVWGTPYEMGYAQGRLLGEEILNLFDGYVLELIPQGIFEWGVGLMPSLFAVETDYQLEIAGMLAGMADSDAGTYSLALGRDITAWDILMANAMADIRGMACSSISAWGDATRYDPALMGQTAVARNLDWTLAGPDEYLLSVSTVVIAYAPSDPSQQRLVSVSFPGFIGCLSCMNESGVVATQNQAHNGIGLRNLDLTDSAYHINLVIRQALAARDIDGDGTSTIFDVYENVLRHPRSGSYLIHTVQQNDGRFLFPAQVIETDNGGTQVRYPLHDPIGSLDVLLATNHFDLLRSPLPCKRMRTLRRIAKSRDGKFDTGALWNAAEAVMQDWMFSTTIHTMLFIPYRRELRLAWSDEETLSGDKVPVTLTWDAMFPEDEGDPGPADDAEDEGADDSDSGCGG